MKRNLFLGILFFAALWGWAGSARATAPTLIGVSLTAAQDDHGIYYINGNPLLSWNTLNSVTTVAVPASVFSACDNLMAFIDYNTGQSGVGISFEFKFFYSDGSSWCWGSNEAFASGNLRVYNQIDPTSASYPYPAFNWYQKGYNDSWWSSTVFSETGTPAYGLPSLCGGGAWQYDLSPYQSDLKGSIGGENIYYRVPFPSVPGAGGICTTATIGLSANTSSTTCNSGVTFSLPVKNTGSVTATNLTVTLPLPPNITLSNAGGGTVSGNTITWTIASLAPGATTTLSWTGTIQAFVGTINVGPASVSGDNIATASSAIWNIAVSCSVPTATPTFTPVACYTDVLTGGTLKKNGGIVVGLISYNAWSTAPSPMNCSGSTVATAASPQMVLYNVPTPTSATAPGTIYKVVLNVHWKNGGNKALDVNFNNTNSAISLMVPVAGAYVKNPVGYGFHAGSSYQWDSLDLTPYDSNWTYAKLSQLVLAFHSDTDGTSGSGLISMDCFNVTVSYIDCPVAGTPTRTRTPTPSFSPSATFTPTFTATRTSTPTPTTTVSPTATPTATPSPSSTNSPTPSHTATVTPTATPTPTFTNTPTPSGSPTQTPTYSPSPTFTNSPTPSATRTATPTSTPSKTFTPSDTATVTPTATPTATETDTFSPSPTPSDTPTRTMTRTVTPTFTDSDTPSGTPTATPTATETVTFSPSPTPSCSPTESATATETITFTGSPTVTFTATETVTFSATFSYTESRTFTDTCTATPPPSATATRTPTRSFTRTRTRTNSPTVTPTFTISNTFTVTPTLSDKTVIFEIKAVYPNPTSDQCIIYYTLANPAQVELTIYNVAGEPIYRYQAQGQAGKNTMLWKAVNDWSGRVASGIYVIRLKATGAENSQGVLRWTSVCVAR